MLTASIKWTSKSNLGIPGLIQQLQKRPTRITVAMSSQSVHGPPEVVAKIIELYSSLHDTILCVGSHCARADLPNRTRLLQIDPQENVLARYVKMTLVWHYYRVENSIGGRISYPVLDT